MTPEEAFKHYEDRAVLAILNTAHFKSHRFVAMIGMQCAIAAGTGKLVRFDPSYKKTIGAYWPDPTENPPEDLGDKLSN